MSLEREVSKRAGTACELCNATEKLRVYEVPETPSRIEGAAGAILVCTTCESQFDAEVRDANHWRCLNDSMWNTEPAVQVMAWRMLQRLKSEGWPQDLLDMMYMEDDTKEWAAAAGDAIWAVHAGVRRGAALPRIPRRRSGLGRRSGLRPPRRGRADPRHRARRRIGWSQAACP